MAQEAKPERIAPGTLTDEDIKHLSSSGELILRNFDPECVKQACYELRAGAVYYDLSQKPEKRIDVPSGEYILLKPRQMVVIITMEEVRLPNDILGRILTKGQLSSIGILPVNTYADPGFDGQLGIVLFNASTSYLKINTGDTIAKIEFSKLSKSVERPYNGQHGYHTKIWPIPRDKILSKEEIKADSRILAPDIELERSYGSEVSNAMSRICRYERRLILSGCAYFTLMLVLLKFTSTQTATSLWIAIGSGVAVNLITALATIKVTSLFEGNK